jgi:hypothetical protein
MLFLGPNSIPKLGAKHRKFYPQNLRKSEPLFLGQVKPPFDPVNPIVHAIEAQAHFRDFGQQVYMPRSMPLSLMRCSRCSWRISVISVRIALRCSSTRFGLSSAMGRK